MRVYLFLRELQIPEPKKSVIFIVELGGHRHGLIWGPQPIPSGIIPNFFGILPDSMSNFREVFRSVSLFLRELQIPEPQKSVIFIVELGGHRHGPIWGPQK